MKNPLIKKIVFAASATTLITGVSVGTVVNGVGDFSFVSSVSAADTSKDVSNLTTNWSVSQTGDNGNSVSLDASFDIQPGVQPGDYVTIKTDTPDGNNIFSFAKFDSVDVKDDAGETLGTLKYVNEHEAQLVFTDYVKTHKDVSANLHIYELFVPGTPAGNENLYVNGITVNNSFIKSDSDPIEYYPTRPIFNNDYSHPGFTVNGISNAIPSYIVSNTVTAYLIAANGTEWDCDNISKDSLKLSILDGNDVATPTQDYTIDSCSPERIELTVNLPAAVNGEDRGVQIENAPAYLTTDTIDNKENYYSFGVNISYTQDDGGTISIRHGELGWLDWFSGTAEGTKLNLPKATDDTNTTPYETAVTTNVLNNDEFGNDGDSWTGVDFVDSNGNSAKTLTTKDGTYVINANNTITFTPNKKFSGVVTEAPTYTVTDSNGNTATAKLTITVSEPAAPTAADDTVKTDYNTPVDIKVLDNDKAGNDGDTFSKVALKDIDGNLVSTLTIKEGTFTVNDDNTVTFTPSKDFSGVVPSVDYQVTDSNGRTADANINVTVGEPVAPVGTVKGVNDKENTKKNTPVTIDVFGNDNVTDDTIKKDSLTLFDKNGESTDTVKVNGGTYTITNDNKVLFTPDKDFTGEVPAVSYGAMTEGGLEYKATVSVTVNGDVVVNPTPEVKGVDDNATTKQDKPVTIDVFGNDTSTPGKIKQDTLTLFDADGNPTTESVKVNGGTYTITDDNKVIFTPDNGFSGKAGSVQYGAMTEDGLEYKANINVTVDKVDVVSPPTSETTPPTDNTTTPPSDNNIPPKDNDSKDDVTNNDTKNNNSENNSVDGPVEGPKVVTDLVGGTSNMDAAGLAGLSAITILGGAAALRRKRK